MTVEKLKTAVANINAFLQESHDDETVAFTIRAIKAIKENYEELIEAKAEIERLKAFKFYFDELYGKGLDIANWHENGALEPFDNFYDSALEEMVGDN